MSWESIEQGRWSWTGDEERHLLLHEGGEMREYHEQPDGPPTVHVYLAPAHGLDNAKPLNGTSWHASHVVAAEHAPWVRALRDAELWEWLAGEGYR